MTTDIEKSVSNSNDNNNPKQKRIAIVGGGGISGLSTIRALKARGFGHVTAYEGSPQVGGIWKSNYSNFSVQIPRVLFEFPDFPMNAIGWEDYATGIQVQEYIESYAAAFGLLDPFVRFNTRVTLVRLLPDDTWALTVESKTDAEEGTAKRSIEHFDYVIIASGLYSGTNQFIPSIPGKEEHFKGELVHSCQFYDASVAEDKRVVVIGGGKSAVDIAVEAALHKASKVTLLPREMHWPSPRKLLGLIPAHNVLLSRLGLALVCTQSGTFPTGTGVLSSKKSRLLSLMTRPIYKLYEILVAWQFNLWGNLYPKEDVMVDFYNIHYSVNDDLTIMRKKGKVELKVGEIAQFEEDGSTLALKDGSTLSADLVVAATGFREDYSFFEDATKLLDIQDDGVYLYRFMLPPNAPNIAFIGHVNAVSNICTYGIQAEWLARYLAGELTETPTMETMVQDIEARKAWARNFMPKSKVRGMTILLHETHYWDCLLNDMGVNPHRKRNIFAEYLMPYGPSDYNGIIGMPAPAKLARRGRWF